MQLRITVTKEILERSKMCGIGKESVGSKCAFALAVRDLLPDAHVSYYTITPFYDDPRRFPITREMTSYISEFDNATPEVRLQFPVQSFDLEIPDWVIDRIDITEVTKLLENHPTLKLQPC